MMNVELEGPRPARLADRDAILEMLNFVFRQSAGREPTFATDWAHIYDAANLENVLIMKRGEQVVASVAIWPTITRIGTQTDKVQVRVGGINGVGTLAEFRKLGLGSQMMEAAHTHMRQMGCHVALLGTQLTNWYRRLGWERAGIQRLYRLDRGNIGLLPNRPAGLSSRFVESEELLPSLLALRLADGLGAVRSPDLWRQLLIARGNPRLYVAERAGKVTAYLLLRQATILEWAGVAEEVAALIRACFDELDDRTASTSQRNQAFQAASLQEITLAAPACGHSLVTLLDQRRIPFHTEYAGMLYLVNPTAILEAYGVEEIGITQEDVLEGSPRFRLSRGAHSVVLSRNTLTKLFFGPERVDDFAADVFPLDFWQWSMDKV